MWKNVPSVYHIIMDLTSDIVMVSTGFVFTELMYVVLIDCYCLQTVHAQSFLSFSLPSLVVGSPTHLKHL